MRLIACGASVIGPRHLDLHEPNQDAMALTGCRDGWIAAVADGLGSRSHSDLGARRACQVSRRILRAAPSTFDLPATLPLIHQPDVTAICDFDIEAVSTGDRDGDTKALTQAIMQAHERIIRQHPDQWYMFRPMWAKPARAVVR